jgi:protein tyrosine phosphatase (PTP) superfamily phosphohydrolase (DUF442 family)
VALEEIYDYRAAGAGLATSGQPSEEQLGDIAAAGFETVINLALHDDPRYSLPDEPGTVARLGMEYVHLPVQFKAPTEADLDAFCEAMDAGAEGRVWVHCAANMRVTAFVGLYRVRRQGWSEEEAFALMRDVWEPDEVWGAFIARMLAARSEG